VSLLKRLVGSASGYYFSLTGIRFLGAILSFAFIILLSRWYGPLGAALFYTYRSVLAFVGDQATGDYQVYVMRHSVYLQSQGRPQDAIVFVRRILLVLGIIYGIACIVVGGNFFQIKLELVEQAGMSTNNFLLLSAAGGMFFVLAQKIAAGLRSFGMAAASLVLQFLIPPLVAVPLLVVVKFFWPSSNALPLLFIYLFGLFAAFLASFVVWERFSMKLPLRANHASGDKNDDLIEDEFHQPSENPRLSRKDFVNRSAFFYWVNGWLKILLDNYPLYFLILVNSQNDIAYFGTAARLLGVTGMIFASLGSDFTTRFARHYFAGRTSEMKMDFWRSQILAVVLFLPFLLAFLFFPHPIFSVFGSSFDGAYPFLVILSIGQLINVGTGLVDGMLYVYRQEAFYLTIRLAGLIIIIILTALGWKILGGAGVALASALVVIFINLAGYIRIISIFNHLPRPLSDSNV
jgi:O-antigen/teichoic acid export membrane protein